MGWGGNFTIASSNVIYTASGGAFLKGLTFVPQQTAGSSEPTPPPVLIAATGVTLGYPFVITMSPDNSAWRSGITNITVNGSSLSPSAYNVSVSGQITFIPANDPALQTAGVKTIVIGATGYSGDMILQTISLGNLGAVTSLNTGAFNIHFTNQISGLSVSVHATNNIAAPKPWPYVGPSLESPAGTYNFTDPSLATNAQMFYYLSQP